MVDEAQSQLHSVRYAALADLLEKTGLDPDPTQPALRQFGTYLTARNGHSPHNGACIVLEMSNFTQGFLRRPSVYTPMAAAPCRSMCDKWQEEAWASGGVLHG